MKQCYREVATHARVSRRARVMIGLMLRELQRGVAEPDMLDARRWERLFGPKQSVVMNLQKLVQTLALLPPETVGEAQKRAEPTAEGPVLTEEEMRLFVAWLQEEKVAQPTA